jgi:hypothetical protein
LTAPSLDPPTSVSTPQPTAFTADVNGTEVAAALIEKSGRVDRARVLKAKLAMSNGLQRIWRSIAG